MRGRPVVVGPINYHELSRKKLQTVCKKRGVPANMTNAAMADALTTLLMITPERVLTNERLESIPPREEDLSKRIVKPPREKEKHSTREVLTSSRVLRSRRIDTTIMELELVVERDTAQEIGRLKRDAVLANLPLLDTSKALREGKGDTSDCRNVDHLFSFVDQRNSDCIDDNSDKSVRSSGSSTRP